MMGALNASRVDELAPYRFGAPLEQANQIRVAHRRFDDQTIEQAAPFEVELQLSEAQHPLASGIVQSQVVRLELEGRWVETDRGHFKLRPQHVARLFSSCHCGSEIGRTLAGSSAGTSRSCASPWFNASGRLAWTAYTLMRQPVLKIR
jgi:hypothetical protein